MPKADWSNVSNKRIKMVTVDAQYVLHCDLLTGLGPPSGKKNSKCVLLQTDICKDVCVCVERERERHTHTHFLRFVQQFPVWLSTKSQKVQILKHGHICLMIFIAVWASTFLFVLFFFVTFDCFTVSLVYILHKGWKRMIECESVEIPRLMRMMTFWAKSTTLFVRTSRCGNWFMQSERSQRFWLGHFLSFLGPRKDAFMNACPAEFFLSRHREKSDFRKIHIHCPRAVLENKFLIFSREKISGTFPLHFIWLYLTALKFHMARSPSIQSCRLRLVTEDSSFLNPYLLSSSKSSEWFIWSDFSPDASFGFVWLSLYHSSASPGIFSNWAQIFHYVLNKLNSQNSIVLPPQSAANCHGWYFPSIGFVTLLNCTVLTGKQVKQVTCMWRKKRIVFFN